MLSLLQLSLPGLKPPSDAFGGEGVGSPTMVESIISRMLFVVTVVGGLLFLTMFVTGAINWITSGGDSGKVASARNRMIQGVLGLVVLVAAYSAVGVVGQIVGINILNFATEVGQFEQQGFLGTQ